MGGPIASPALSNLCIDGPAESVVRRLSWICVSAKVFRKKDVWNTSRTLKDSTAGYENTLSFFKTKGVYNIGELYYQVQQFRKK